MAALGKSGPSFCLPEPAVRDPKRTLRAFERLLFERPRGAATCFHARSRQVQAEEARPETRALADRIAMRTPKEWTNRGQTGHWVLTIPMPFRQ